MMKTIFIFPLVMILAGFGSVWADTPESLQGKWVGEAKPSVYDDWCQGAPDMTINIKPDGKIKGYASDEDGNRMRIRGKVKDGKIDVFPLSTPIGTIKFITVDVQTEEKISGTWKANKSCQGTWVFTKKK